jgi:triosephosphate isomerase
MTTSRRPMAISNWKMDKTVAQSLAFVREFEIIAGELLEMVDVIICPPFTALWAVAQQKSSLQLGGQNIAPSANPARMGEISAALLADAGCQWVMLGHWEIRRHMGDDDPAVNRKVHLALEAGLHPVVLVGEGRGEMRVQTALKKHLASVLDGCRTEDIASMAFVYEPEGAIGVSSPASPQHVANGCAFIRGWLRGRWGDDTASSARIIYGGSVAPEYAADLLAYPDVDGLGATRRGRDPVTFAAIVRQIAIAKP